MLVIRPSSHVVADLSSRDRASVTISRKSREVLAACLPADYLSLVDFVGAQELAGDFVLLDLAEMLNETAGRDHPMIDLGKTWWVIGTSGTGDAWLLRRTEFASRVAFLDHDQGTSAQGIDMGIDFMQWLQLADLMAQVEESTCSPPNVGEIALAMNSLSMGLSERYPYKLDV